MNEFHWVGVVLLVTGAISGGLVALAMWGSSISCAEGWKDSGFQSRWGVWTGCQIQRDGKWVPSSVYREFDQ